MYASFGSKFAIVNNSFIGFKVNRFRIVVELNLEATFLACHPSSTT